MRRLRSRLPQLNRVAEVVLPGHQGLLVQMVDWLLINLYPSWAANSERHVLSLLRLVHPLPPLAGHQRPHHNLRQLRFVDVPTVAVQVLGVLHFLGVVMRDHFDDLVQRRLSVLFMVGPHGAVEKLLVVPVLALGRRNVAPDGLRLAPSRWLEALFELHFAQVA